MAYPSSKTTFTTIGATNKKDESGFSHRARHNDIQTLAESIEDVVGTTAGTSFAKDFAAGDFAARINSSNVLQQAITGTVSATSGTLTGVTINSGTLAAPILGTPVMDKFTTSASTLPTLAQRAVAPTVGTLTDAVGTIATNAAIAQVFEINLGTTAGNRTLAAPTNPTDGQFIAYRIKQNADDTGTLVWNAVFRWNSDNGTATLGTASTFNYMGFRYNDTDTKWDSQGKNINII